MNKSEQFLKVSDDIWIKCTKIAEHYGAIRHSENKKYYTVKKCKYQNENGERRIRKIIND